MYKNALTISELENLLYDFFSGVLPKVVDTENNNLGFLIRFAGYITQKHPAHVDLINRNHCYIKTEKINTLNRFEQEDDNCIQEVEFVYSVELESKQTNFLENTALSNAIKLAGYRCGYDIFQKIGISKFNIVNQSIRVERQNTFFCVLMNLTVIALIRSEGVKKEALANNLSISVFDKDEKNKPPLYSLKVKK